MSLRKALEEALDAHTGGAGQVEAEHGEARASADVEAVGPIGVRLKGLRIKAPCPVDVENAAQTYPERLRGLGEDLIPVEVSPTLGGTNLRTHPDRMRDGEFFDVDVRSDGTTGIQRQKVGSDGGRKAVPWTMTRDQLGRLVDDLEED